MNMILKPATPTERLYICEQNTQIAEKCGSPGYLWGELDNTGTVFLHCWETYFDSNNTPELKAEFNTVLDMLRFDERYGHLLKNRSTMIVYCLDHPEGKFRNGYEYAFRADTKDYSYMIRCIPAGEENHVYIYPYHRESLDRHMKQAEKGICFITPDGKKKFKVPDGEHIRIITGGGGTRDRTVRYIDEAHIELGHKWGSTVYHIREFAERLEQTGGTVIPIRSTLPDKCYNVLPNGDEIITIKKGEDGFCHTDKYGHDRQAAQDIVDEYNERNGVTKAQAAAMLAGATLGWDTPDADPKNYDEQGQPIKPRPHGRGDTR